MSKGLRHTLAWLGFSLFLFAAIAGLSNLAIAVIKVPVIMLGVIVTFYINSEYLLPRFYGQKKMVAFLALNLLLISALTIISTMLTQFLLHSEHFMDLERPGGPHKHPPRHGPPPGPGRPPRQFMREFAQLESLFTNAMPAIFASFLSRKNPTLKKQMSLFLLNFLSLLKNVL